MKIRVDKQEEVEEAIAEAQLGASVRLVSCGNVLNLVAMAEEHLQEKGIALSYAGGCRFAYRPVVNVNRYGWQADTTIITIERGSAAWFLVGVLRISINTSRGSERSYTCVLTEGAQARAVEMFAKSLDRM